MPKKSLLQQCVYIALTVLLLDQISKYFVVTYLSNGPVAVIPSLNFHLSFNEGAAFGFLSTEQGWQRWFLITVAMIMTAIILTWSARLKAADALENIGLGLILGGAWGNLCDRIISGRVTDYIDFYIGNWHWYTFNVADIAICCGVAMMFWFIFKK